MRKWKNGLLMLAVVMCLGMFFKLPVYASADTSERIDFSKNGTGTLTIRYETIETTDDEGNIIPGTGVPEAEFTIYLVEELVEDNGVQKLQWASGFEDCTVSLQNLSNSQQNQAAKKLEAFVRKNHIQGRTWRTDDKGYVKFTNLTFGTYLVVLTDVPEDYGTIDPFLISVPLEKNGTIKYDVVAIPKTGEFPLLEPESYPPAEPETPVTPPPPSEPEKVPEKLPQTGPARWIIPLLFVCSLVVFASGWILLKKKPGKFLMFGGVLLFAAMIGVTVYQNYTERVSEDAAADLLAAYEAGIGLEDAIVRPSGIDADDMDYVVIDEAELIGTISIPAIDITLPVIKDCTSSGLKKAPCRYKGNAEESSMIIAAHNYGRHFGKISLLRAGDEVTFTDVDGVEYCYEVQGTETLGAYDVEQMLSGDWDLTLFTCTYGGQNRITVRCSLKE